MPEITIKEALVVKCSSKISAEAFPTFKAENYDDKKNELTIDANLSPDKPCWRLVHDGKIVVDMFESGGVTVTAHKLFCGTEEECQKEIDALSLAKAEGNPGIATMKSSGEELFLP